MDSDCLVKLTKAEAKEVVIEHMEVYIPPLVKRETVDEAKERGYQDAFIIEENLAHNGLHIGKHKGKAGFGVPVAKGESEVVSLYLDGGYDAIASDDRRFLKKLEALGIPYLTPTACIIYLFKAGKIDKRKALNILDGLRPFVSDEEYMISRFYLERES